MRDLKELDVVAIPTDLALAERVRPRGTVVWLAAGAPYATVECQCSDDNADGVRTKLLDIELEDLRTI